MRDQFRDPRPDVTRPVRVLVVDDEEDDFILTEDALSGVDGLYELSWVSSFDEAMPRIASGTYDVVLVDYRLGKNDGVELIQWASAQGHTVPMILLTGQGNRDVDLAAMEAGAADYLVKDAPPYEMERSIRYALARSQAAELRASLRHADRLAAVGQLAASVAHEVNNPAAFVLANLDVLDQRLGALEVAFNTLLDGAERSGIENQERRRLVDEARKAFVESPAIIRDSRAGMQRIATIVRELCSFSAAKQHKVEMVDINGSVRLACRLVYNEIRHRARLVEDLTQLPTTQTDPDALCQILVNLLMNAAQAIEPGAAHRNQITVTTRREGASLMVAVADTGCGIPDEDRARIFEPFHTTKRVGEGTGLGLALCQDLIARLGGTISVESSPGNGARFVMAIPHIEAQPPTQDSAAADSDGEPDRPARTGRVLLIDDEPMILDAYTRLLGLGGHEVLAVAGGEPALELLQMDRAFDVILCDLMMPDVDGMTVFERLGEIDADLRRRVVFCSGGVFTTRAREFVEQTSNTVLEKPLSGAVLLETVAQFCDGRSHH